MALKAAFIIIRHGTHTHLFIEENYINPAYMALNAACISRQDLHIMYYIIKWQCLV